GKSFAIPPESVTSARVEAVEWQASRSAVGTLIAVRAVTLASEVPGLVREIGFDSGTFVRKGDMLVKLDSSIEEGQLAAARAEADLARASLQRARSLREAHASSPADLDAADAKAKQAAANVVTLQATIGKKTIRAPFDGAARGAGHRRHRGSPPALRRFRLRHRGEEGSSRKRRPDRAPEVRPARGAARRSGGGGLRAQNRGDRREQRRLQAAQWRSG